MRISSFNIRCYGLGGEYTGKFRDEKRNHKLKQFIHKELADYDAMVFQEIVDVEAFKTLIPYDYNTFTYEHDYKRHQRIVICVKDTYEFKNHKPIEKVKLDEHFSRPAFYGELIDKTSNKTRLHLIGVHLKSGDDHTETRLKQCGEITDFIKNLEQASAPTVVTGDFNSHTLASTGLSLDDSKLMDQVFKTTGLSIVENTTSTYHTHWEQQVLDHFWISKSSLPHSKISVYDINKYDGDVKTYYKEISDHLPIQISF